MGMVLFLTTAHFKKGHTTVAAFHTTCRNWPDLLGIPCSCKHACSYGFTSAASAEEIHISVHLLTIYDHSDFVTLCLGKLEVVSSTKVSAKMFGSPT